MSTCKKLSFKSRGVAMATIALLVLTMSEPPAASAATVAPLPDGLSASTASSIATDFSSARRRDHRHVRRGNNAAGLAFMGLAIGTIGAIVAEQRRRDYYENCYGCGYGYGYAPGYYYRAPPPYYGRPYYRYYPY